MRSLNATIFTEIALSLVAINNAPTWIKALWIEQELEARGLWRDDVFDLIRPFLVTGNINPPEEKNQPVPAPKPLLKPAGPRPEFVVSRPVQTVEEAKWAPSFEVESDEGDSVAELDPNRSDTSSERNTPLRVTGYQADQPRNDGVKSALPLPIDDYDAESELWEPERETALHYAELSTEQAELASMMHLLAVSTRLESDSAEIESQAVSEAEPTEKERSYVIDEASISVEPANTGAGDGMVPTTPLSGQEPLADSTEVEQTEAVRVDEPIHQGIAIEWVSEPENEVETGVESRSEPIELLPDIVPDEVVTSAEELPAEPELDLVTEVDHPMLSPLPEPVPNEGVPAAATELVLSESPLELVSDESGSANQEPMEPDQESNITPVPNEAESGDDLAAWANAWQETVAVPEPKPDSTVSSLGLDTQIESDQGGTAIDAPRDEGSTTTELPADQSPLTVGPSEPTDLVAPEPGKSNQERSKSSRPRKRISTVSSRVTERRGKKIKPVHEVKHASTQSRGETRPTELAVPAALRTNSKADDDHLIEPAEPAKIAATKAPKKKSKSASPKKHSLVPPEPLSEATRTQLTDPPISAPAQIAEKRTAFASPAKIKSPKMNPPAKPPRKKTSEAALAVSCKPSHVEPISTSPVTGTNEASTQSTEKRFSLPNRAKRAVKVALARSLRIPTQSDEPKAGPTPPSDTGTRPASKSQTIAKESAKPTPEHDATPRKRRSIPRVPNAAAQTNHGGQPAPHASQPAANTTSWIGAVSKSKKAVSLTDVIAGKEESTKKAKPKSQPVVKKRTTTPAQATAVRAVAKKRSSTESVDVINAQVGPKKSTPRKVAKKKTVQVAQRSSKRVTAQSTKPTSVAADADKSALKKAREQETMDLADAAAIADLYGLHIDTASASDRARLLFFASSLKTSDGDWTGSETQLEAALNAAERSKHPELWKQVIEQSMKIHRKLGRPAA